MTQVYPVSSRAAKSSKLPRAAPISVNGVVINRDAIGRETQNHPATKPVEAWLAAARALVVRELLLQEARRLNVKAEPECDDEGRRESDEEALVRALVEQEVKTPEADDSTCRRYYEQNRPKFRSSELYEVRHILFAAAPGDAGQRAHARADADAAIVALKSKARTFEDLAAMNSACPSGRTGGHLGQISRGQTVPEFEEALGNLPIGDVADEPIETRYGFHVTAVDRRIDGTQLPFDMVKAKIAAWLSERVHRMAVRQYISMLAARAEIVGIDLSADEARRAH
jgi:peptidyl-prolyl cis-trans isomerase C